MQANVNKKNEAADSIVSPKMVREMLGMDNSQIQELCKTASIKPKKDEKGLTYFTKGDLEIMKDFTGAKTKMLQSKLAMMQAQKRNSAIANKIDDDSMVKLIQSLKNIETAITEKVSSIMDEKLDGMDDVVVELIRCKTENETLRYKINELNKENYNLKNELSSYKNVALNVYVKKSN